MNVELDRHCLMVHSRGYTRCRIVTAFAVVTVKINPEVGNCTFTLGTRPWLGAMVL